MTEWGSTFHASSSLCQISSTAFASEGGRAGLSAIHVQKFAMDGRSEDSAGMIIIEYPVYRELLGHVVQHVVLYYLDGRKRLTDV